MHLLGLQKAYQLFNTEGIKSIFIKLLKWQQLKLKLFKLQGKHPLCSGNEP